MTTIVEVERRSDQGVLRPFLCVGDNGRRYFVKGHRAGRSSLIAEWIGGNLGRALGLPIPAFEIVNVPPEIAASGAVEGIAELGSGPAFASELVPLVQELGATHLPLVPLPLKRNILLFDWWIRNEDRKFNGSAGNPNLLWDNQTNALVVIDHNAAFDPFFDAEAFWHDHTFSSEKSAFADVEYRREQTVRLDQIMNDYPAIEDAIPEEWHFEDLGQSVKTDFDFDQTRAILASFRKDEFWTIVGV